MNIILPHNFFILNEVNYKVMSKPDNFLLIHNKHKYVIPLVNFTV